MSSLNISISFYFDMALARRSLHECFVAIKCKRYGSLDRHYLGDRVKKSQRYLQSAEIKRIICLVIINSLRDFVQCVNRGAGAVAVLKICLTLVMGCYLAPAILSDRSLPQSWRHASELMPPAFRRHQTCFLTPQAFVQKKLVGCKFRHKKSDLPFAIFREGPGHRPKGLSQQITTFVQTFSLFKTGPSPF